MTRKKRLKKIVAQYNRWLGKYVPACDRGDWGAAAYYAFMLNAVTEEIFKSPDVALRRYFNTNSRAENHDRIRVSGT